MKLGVNTVDVFSGDHIAHNTRPELNELTLVELVKRTHRELGADVVELPANLMVICPRLFTERTIEALADYQKASNVGYTVHLPFRGLDVSSLCRPIAEASVASYKDHSATRRSLGSGTLCNAPDGDDAQTGGSQTPYGSGNQTEDCERHV